jgi:hypothetical protein
MGFWEWIRSVGGNREAEADEREEYGGEDPGESEVERWAAADRYSPGAETAEADLKDFEPPRDQAP